MHKLVFGSVDSNSRWQWAPARTGPMLAHLFARLCLYSTSLRSCRCQDGLRTYVAIPQILPTLSHASHTLFRINSTVHSTAFFELLGLSFWVIRHPHVAVPNLCVSWPTAVASDLIGLHFHYCSLFLDLDCAIIGALRYSTLIWIAPFGAYFLLPPSLFPVLCPSLKLSISHFPFPLCIDDSQYHMFSFYSPVKYIVFWLFLNNMFFPSSHI